MIHSNWWFYAYIMCCLIFYVPVFITRSMLSCTFFWFHIYILQLLLVYRCLQPVISIHIVRHSRLRHFDQFLQCISMIRYFGFETSTSFSYVDLLLQYIRMVYTILRLRSVLLVSANFGKSYFWRCHCYALPIRLCTRYVILTHVGILLKRRTLLEEDGKAITPWEVRTRCSRCKKVIMPIMNPYEL